MNDQETKRVFSANVQRILAEQGHNVRWLQLATDEYPNRIYPAVRGDAMPSAGLLHRIAKALNVSVDLLLDDAATPAKAQRSSRRALASAG